MTTTSKKKTETVEEKMSIKLKSIISNMEKSYEMHATKPKGDVLIVLEGIAEDIIAIETEDEKSIQKLDTKKEKEAKKEVEEKVKLGGIDIRKNL